MHSHTWDMLANYFKSNVKQTCRCIAYITERRPGKINHAALNKGSPVIDFYHDTSSILNVGDLDDCAKGQRFMRSCF